MGEREQHDQDLIQVNEWLDGLDKTGVVGYIDRELLNRTLDALGASLEIKDEEERSLRAYSNKSSREGMDAVWGEKRYQSFVAFCNNWVDEFEAVSGNQELPKLEKSGRKNAGMKEFFHQLTAFSYGVTDFETFALYTEARLKNGKLWQAGRKEEREKLTTPISGGEKKMIASIPPGFIPDFWKWLKSTSDK